MTLVVDPPLHLREIADAPAGSPEARATVTTRLADELRAAGLTHDLAAHRDLTTGRVTVELRP